jgi:putative copper resistance protein D
LAFDDRALHSPHAQAQGYQGRSPWLVGSGLINSWFLVGSFTNLTSTAYGQLLIVKLFLFAGMLALAALNRFIIVPRLTKANEVGEHAVAMVKLRRHILGEQALGLFIILVVSALGTMEPAIN